MSYTERIYIQNANPCVRNKDIFNVHTSSDWCEFIPPMVEMTGATKIQPVSATSEGVHLITGDTDISLGIIFSGGPTPYSASSVDNIIEVYKYNTDIDRFIKPYVYLNDSISLSGDVVNSAATIDLPISALPPDNEYLIKPYFEFEACTEFLDILGARYDNRILNGSNYRFYNEDFDYYISVSRPADTPIFEISTGNIDVIYGKLMAYSVFPTISGQTTFNTRNYLGEIMVVLNGVTLANNYDYTYSGNVVTISAGTRLTDVVTIIHSANNETATDGLTNDLIQITSPITSGSTDGQGTNDVYYNTTQNKYEIYTILSFTSNSNVIVTLNGVALANNIDYYTSISNNKRIILTGDLIVGDVINVYYFSNTSYVGGIYVNNPSINWSIENAPQDVNGYFTLQLSTASTFNTIQFSSVTDYVIGQMLYNDELSISGAVGTQYYYRVMNEKFYQPITGNTIDTVAYSDSVPIIIQTDAINSY